MKPRLQTYYEEHVRSRLSDQFGWNNAMRVPRLEKVVLNVGLGEAPKNSKLLDSVVEELGIITGQRPVVTKARKAISNFGLRAGMPIGAAVTLRGERIENALVIQALGEHEPATIVGAGVELSETFVDAAVLAVEDDVAIVVGAHKHRGGILPLPRSRWPWALRHGA